MRLAASLLAFSLAVPALAARGDDLDRHSPRSRSDARATPRATDAELVLAQYAPPPPSPATRPAPSPYAQPAPAPYARPAPAPYARPAPAPYARPAPAPYARPAQRGGRYRTYVGPGAALGALSFWGGWGLGWGYYPLYPLYPQAYQQPYPPGGAGSGDGYYPPGDGYYPPDAGGYPAANPDRVFVRLGAAAAGMPDGAVGGFTLALDGRTAGFSASVDALVLDDVTRVGDTGGDALGWGTAHFTWSVLADASFRIRLELGGSMLSLPKTGAFAAMTRAGDVAFGPDVGISGQLGLVGPIGLEGHARVTPFPIPVVDARLAVALRGGPLALTAGWRGIRVYRQEGEVPDVDFSGPELGLSIVF
jgi:hypothetical protein